MLLLLLLCTGVGRARSRVEPGWRVNSKRGRRAQRLWACRHKNGSRGAPSESLCLSLLRERKAGYKNVQQRNTKYSLRIIIKCIAIKHSETNRTVWQIRNDGQITEIRRTIDSLFRTVFCLVLGLPHLCQECQGSPRSQGYLIQINTHDCLLWGACTIPKRVYADISLTLEVVYYSIIIVSWLSLRYFRNMNSSISAPYIVFRRT